MFVYSSFQLRRFSLCILELFKKLGALTFKIVTIPIELTP